MSQPSLPTWWMPSYTHPISPCIQNHFIVHIESNDCHATNRSYAYDADASRIPRKMLRPHLPSRVKERCHFPAERIF
jgi:hypothetical protein